MRQFKVKPKKGLIVRDPVTREPLKANGETKPRNAYWLRRKLEGSVTIIDLKKSDELKKETQS